MLAETMVRKDSNIHMHKTMHIGMSYAKFGVIPVTIGAPVSLKARPPLGLGVALAAHVFVPLPARQHAYCFLGLGLAHSDDMHVAEAIERGRSAWRGKASTSMAYSIPRCSRGRGCACHVWEEAG